jgi:hypothetical protein
MELTNDQILEKLSRLEVDVGILKEKVSEDLDLSEDDEKLFEESFINEKEGNLISSEQLKKEFS